MVLLIGSGSAADVPFVFDSSSSGVAGYSADQLESLRVSSPDLAGVPSVTTPSDNEVLQFPVTGGGSTPGNTTEKNAGDLKKALDARVEPDNSRVRDEAVVLALKYPGEKTIEQITSIYNYLKNGDGSKKGWGYVSDPRGIDYFMFANQTLKNGDRANCVGGGDCDDFAILMSALVESVGGTTRIILARNSSIGGHAYTEVYLGNLDEQKNQVEGIIDWLKQEFNTDKIFTHIDTASKDVWLNLDWGPDEKGNTHPGGPFFQGDKHIVLCIRDRYEKTSLTLSETLQEDAKQSEIIQLENVSGPDNQTKVFEPPQDGDRKRTIVQPASVLLEGHSDYVWSVAFSPNGLVLASGSDDNTIKLWDTASGTEIRTLKGHNGQVLSVAFSPDGRALASGSGDSSLKLWDTASGTEIITLNGHSNTVRCVAFSPDGGTLVSGSCDGTIKLWNIASGTEIRTLTGLSSVYSVAFSPDSDILASGEFGNTIELWDTASGKKIKALTGYFKWVESVAFSPDGGTLASGGSDGTIKLWDIVSGTEIRTLQGQSGLSGIRSVAFSSDGLTLASGDDSGPIKLWNTASGNEIRTLQLLPSVYSVAFSPDGRTLASGVSDGTIRLWNVA